MYSLCVLYEKGESCIKQFFKHSNTVIKPGTKRFLFNVIFELTFLP